MSLAAIGATAIAAPTPCQTGPISDLVLRWGRGDQAAFSVVLDIFSAAVLAVAAPEDIESGPAGQEVVSWPK